MQRLNSGFHAFRSPSQVARGAAVLSPLSCHFVVVPAAQSTPELASSEQKQPWDALGNSTHPFPANKRARAKGSLVSGFATAISRVKTLSTVIAIDIDISIAIAVAARRSFLL